MRIVMFSETYLPHINGAVTHIKMLNDALSAMGHQVIVATTSDVREPVLKDNVLYSPGHRMKKIYDYRIANPISVKRTEILASFKPDIFHIHNEFGMGLAALRAAKRLDVPVVYTLHSEYDKYMFYLGKSFAEASMIRMARKYLGHFVKNADIILSPSPKAQAYVDSVNMGKDVLVLPNAVNSEPFREACADPLFRRQFRREHNMADNCRAFVFVGRLGKEKSVHDLVHYFGRLNLPKEKARLFIIGKGPETDSLHTLIADEAYDDRILLLGSLPNEELPAYLTAMDYYMTASLSEMHSISLLEATAAGLPAVIRLDPPNAWQIEDGVNGFTWADESALKTLMERLLSQTAEEERALRERVIQYAKTHDVSHQAEELLKIYEDAIRLHALRKAN